MFIVMLGAPGVGKGTQAVLMSEFLNVPHVSTGDMLRSAVAKGTDLGKAAKEYMDQGGLVPDDIVIGIVTERLQEADSATGAILDGFPRTVIQAKALDEALGDVGKRIDVAINIDVPEQIIVRRMAGRRSCRACGAVFHVDHKPPAEADVCDACGAELYQRLDDAEDTVRNRLAVYQEKTAPLIEYYRSRGVLVEIDGDRPVDVVTDAVKDALSIR